jgi:uncharacterized membrane protein HdeD (DUF308 family)
MLRKGNPLQTELRWEIVLVEGLVAAGIGLYALLAQESARRNIIFLIGAFLLINGLSYAFGGVRRLSKDDPMARFRFIRAGIGAVTGSIVVIDRFADFMSIDAARVVLAIGLLGIGVVTLIGLVTVRGEVERRLAGIIVSLLLAGWGILVLYVAGNDTNTARVLGWAGLIVGAVLILLALYRRQSGSAQPAGG